MPNLEVFDKWKSNYKQVACPIYVQMAISWLYFALQGAALLGFEFTEQALVCEHWACPRNHFVKIGLTNSCVTSEKRGRIADQGG